MGCMCKKAEAEPSNLDTETNQKPVENMDKPLESPVDDKQIPDDKSKVGSMVASVIIIY